MGRISKAIKLKLQELRIDDIFKDGILKYKGSLSNEDSKNEASEDNNVSKDSKNEVEEKQQAEDNYEHDSIVKIELDKKSISEENINKGQRAEEDNLNFNNIEDNIRENNNSNSKKIDNSKEIETLKKSEQILKHIETNETMMQYFEWYYPCDGSLWNRVKENAKKLRTIGITALWLPPACKAADGIYDVGYGSYDLYDLGEFDQKGTVKTKYGTKDEYLKAIEESHKNNIKVYGDVVFNHKGGADEAETVSARPVSSYNRNEFVGEEREIRSHTVFNFPGRGDKYSAYKWTANDFDGVDFDDITKEYGIFKFEGKEWEKDVDLEYGNYDFLMFADLDMDSPYVVNELKSWGKWYLYETNVDGFRLDAIKHIKFDFFEDWLKDMRKESKKELFAVGEYWTHNVNSLENYMDKCGGSMSLFDAPLHFNFQNASNSLGLFDMRTLMDNTYLKVNPDKAVTFVDNHDTQLGQSLESWVQPWFKPLAYTFILTRQEGYPCVFYGDYYGIPEMNFDGIKDELDIILKIRKDYAYGMQHDYMDNESIIGWTREGNNEHEESGVAAIITVNYGGTKIMYVGIHHKGEIWIDATKQLTDKVVIDENGCGIFRVLDGSYSIWIKEN
ncbi:alpha-amylase [Clostridium gelidum]|uniref:Alpha-amylase n=1 Tax=Clostridium gelidum TaxID=704125 RepID=A0ABM7T529_9CLOT|nr:alpha-amylase [Clostridium gelidum]BCZ46045.1 alpha-amylase [Clostridium gelidum]